MIFVRGPVYGTSRYSLLFGFMCDGMGPCMHIWLHHAFLVSVVVVKLVIASCAADQITTQLGDNFLPG